MKKLWLSLALLLPLASSAPAGVPCTLPFNLQNGTPADATQVMANYQALVTCLGQAAAAGVNSDITALTALTTPITPAQGGSVVFVGGVTTGSANTQVLAGTTPTFIPTEGFIATFTAGFTNTGAATLQIGATPASALMRKTVFGLSATAGGEIIVGQTYGVRYRASAAQYEILTMEMQVPGEIRDFGGTAAPPGWFLADGSCKSRTTFAALFAVIGTVYDPTGSTCDINSFALPDARGRTLIGQDTTGTRVTVAGSSCNGNVLGGAGCGAQNQTLVVNQLPDLTRQAGSNLRLTNATVAVFEPGGYSNQVGVCPGGPGACGHSHVVLEPGYDINGSCTGSCGHQHGSGQAGFVMNVGSGGAINPTGSFGIVATTALAISGIGIRTDITGISAGIVDPAFTGTLQVRTGAQTVTPTLPPLQVVNKIIKF